MKMKKSTEVRVVRYLPQEGHPLVHQEGHSEGCPHRQAPLCPEAGWRSSAIKLIPSWPMNTPPKMMHQRELSRAALAMPRNLEPTLPPHHDTGELRAATAPWT